MTPTFSQYPGFGDASGSGLWHGDAAISLLVLTVLLAMAVYGEVKDNRIPNWLTASGMAAGILIGYWQGSAALWSHLGGLAIGFGFLFVFYLFGGIGGGDVKLMGAVGALMGAELIKPTLFYTAAIGALLAVMIVIWRKDFWLKLAWAGQRLAFWRPVLGEAPAASGRVTVPYGIAIAIGSLITLLLS